METNSGGADDWRTRAHCAGLDAEDGLHPDDWYAEEYTAISSVASAMCFQCPVRMECLKEACDNTEPHGIWGGLPWSIRQQKGQAHNFLKLVDLPDPYSTEDSNSPFHISNLGGSDE